jgi:acetyl-CoA acyltransferase
MSALLADLPQEVSGVTINRFCSSGLQTQAYAYQQIALGQADSILAGGVESMSMIPMMGHHPSVSPAIFESIPPEPKLASMVYSMGITAENVADKYNISRDRQDEFALRSHKLALEAMTQGYFKSEIIPQKVNHNFYNAAEEDVVSHKETIMMDEGPRADTNLKALNKLRTVFKANGSVTAGNSSQMSDGAGLTWLASASFVEKHQLEPIAEFLGYSVAGVDPALMGMGPTAAIPKALKLAGLSLNDIDWIELNEAFAAQALAVMDEMNLDSQIVNPQGGAIALGHPLGATGAIRTATLLHGLKRTQKKYGLVSMCIGTGMGACGVFKAM